MDTAYENFQTWQKFALLEMAMDKLPRKKHMTALRNFIYSNYDMKLICRENKLDISNLDINDVIESALVKLSRRFDYIPPDRQIRMLQIFDEEGDLTRTLKRSADEILTIDGQEFPKQDQWPFAMPSEMQLKLLKQLYNGTASEHHAALRYSFRMMGYNSIKTAEVLGLSDVLVTEKDYKIIKEFDELLSQMPQEQHEGARSLLIANNYNIETTCTHLAIKRFPGKQKKKKSEKTVIITGNFKNIPLPKETIWPDKETCTPALLPNQLLQHPNIVDLHYYTFKDAREALRTFISYHRRLNTGEVRIITGREKNSTNTKNTIFKLADIELKNMGVEFNRNPRNSGEIIANVRRV